MVVLMAVAIAQSAALDNHRMVEQSAIAVLGALQFSKEISELLHVVGVDLGYLLDHLGIAAVMS
jgi:hypothetical protein